MENIIHKEEYGKYDFGLLKDFLRNNPEYKNIAVQFDEKLSDQSLDIFNRIKDEVSDKFFFIVGDTSYSHCCADDIAALHLKADLIIRVGDSCLTKNKQLPVYFLFECERVDENAVNKIKENLTQLAEEDKVSKVYVFYHYKYTKIFEEIKITNNNLPENINISIIPYSPSAYEGINSEDNLIIYSRVFKNSANIDKNDKIVYYGEEDDKLLCEISIRFMNSNKIYTINKDDYSVNIFSSKQMSSIYYKRFNLIEKAKESETFGIIVGSLSISGLNEIIEEVKRVLRVNNKKYYTFLLGKITLEKLSNFVDYIDCFILIACPFSDNYNFKTLMKPLVSPLDIQMAFNGEKFPWDMSYTFDTNYILSKCKCEEKNECSTSEEKINEESDSIHSTYKIPNINSLSLKENEKNQALANVFSFKTLANFDSKKYKGLDVNETKREVEKFKLGRTGIPLKYEDII